ncbi:MAG: tetratricopeptide repeat protein [Alphaproteobacteria bacterium]|nr:tetratricopeptide repeat protein [Alphaproteobacteria bacterium]
MPLPPQLEARLDQLLEETLVDAYDEDEQLTAFCAAFEDLLRTPMRATVLGQPVEVVSVDYPAGPHRGLTAACVLPDGSRHEVTLVDVRWPSMTTAWLLAGAHRRWVGLEPFPEAAKAPPAPAPTPAEPQELDLSAPVDLLVLGVRQQAARCRALPEGPELTLRTSGAYDLVPGEILTLEGNKQWRHGGHLYLSGDVTGRRLELPWPGLRPLALEPFGEWDPLDCWSDEEEHPPEVRRILDRGPREAWEMEQVVPGLDLAAYDDGPILRAIELERAGDHQGARRTLMDVLIQDLRCLDAHVHLGNFELERWPKHALRHYQVAVGVGELSLGEGFDGVLPWSLIDNRPFLRALHGLGLCLWRLGQPEEAKASFERMMDLNPTDNTGARFLLQELQEGRPWTPR